MTERVEALFARFGVLGLPAIVVVGPARQMTFDDPNGDAPLTLAFDQVQDGVKA